MHLNRDLYWWNWIFG